MTFDMAVLATGMVPNALDENLPLDLDFDEYGFTELLTRGVYMSEDR